MCTVWARCPLAAAIQVASEEKIRIGWTVARVELLKARPTQCYRCWQYGHVRSACTAKEDYSNACFNCGNHGHAMRECRAKPYCVLCGGKSRNPEHRSDSNICETLRDFSLQWLCRPDGLSGRCSLVTRGDYSVTIKYKNLHLISCYISPNIRINKYLEALDELEDIIRILRKRIIICGDFNAKSTLWGSRTLDSRGSYSEDWAAGNELQVVNMGKTPTCVRQQGSSIPDITWATSDAIGDIREWQVDLEQESLSDHRYVEFKVNLGGGKPQTSKSKVGSSPR